MKDLLDLINMIISNVIDKDYKSREFPDKDDFLKHMQKIRQFAMNNNEKALDYFTYAFGNTGYLKEIASVGGWLDDFSRIEKEFGYLVGEYRVNTKNDPRITNFVDPATLGNSFASNPGKIILSDEKYNTIVNLHKKGLFNSLFSRGKKRTLAIDIFFGDTNPAIVVSLKPLLVAAYSFDLDAVVILTFPDEYVKQYQLEMHSHLISVNVYYTRKAHMDIYYGKYYSAWADFGPTIVNFLTDDTNRLKDLVEAMPKCLWVHVQSLAEEYLSKHPRFSRPGFWFIKE